MNDTKITCPSCGHEFPLTDTLAGPVIGELKRDYEARLAAEKAARDQALAEQKARIETEARARAIDAQATELADLRAQAREQAEKLAEAQKVQAAALRRERELEERERAFELRLEEKLSAALKDSEAKRTADYEERLKAKSAEISEQAQLQTAEKDDLIAGLKRQIETLQRKADQGSQQRQGEAAEIVLETQLGGAFPGDDITPVGKGQRGADCLQRVTGPAGPVGAILWEVKETQNWSRDWLPKLREDARTAEADIAVLISRARPDGIDSFAFVDGVWVAAPRYAVPLASVLRDRLAEVALARGQRQGQASKTELLYDYLTGPQFRARVEAVVERFETLRDDLERERKTMTALWARREKALGLARDAMVGMYGDVQGIAGSSVPDIEGLEPPLLSDE